MPSFSTSGDLAGLRPVYYNSHHLDRGFESTPQKLTNNPQIDEVTLAGSIMWPGISALTANYTYFEDIRTLQPGEVATISDGEMRSTPSFPRESQSATAHEIAPTIGRALLQYIMGLAEQPELASCDFSGGLDSTTLALALARRCPTNKAILGLVQHSIEYPAGDISYARRFAQLGNITLRELVTPQDNLPFARNPPSGLSPYEPYRGTTIFGREMTRLRQAKHYHVTGDGGDALFDPEPLPILVDLLTSGQEAQAKNLALTVARASLKSPLIILEEARAKTDSDLSASYERVSKQLLSDNVLPESKDWLPPLGIASTWLTPKIREALAARAQELAKRASNTTCSSFATYLAIRNSGDAHRHLQMLGKYLGIHTLAPYLNRAVLEPAIILPAAQRTVPGQFKPLLRAASAAVSLAPPKIFRRQSKGSYSAELLAGFRANLPTIRARLQDLRLARMGIVDPDAILLSLGGNKPPLASLGQLFAVEDWLSYLGIDAPRQTISPARHKSAPQLPATVVKLPAGAYRISPSLHTATGHKGQLIALDDRTGELFSLAHDPTTQLIIRTIAETHSPQHTLEALRRHYPEEPVERLTTDLASWIHKLVQEGLLQLTNDDEIRIKQVLAPQLPHAMAQRVIAYIQAQEETTAMDAHHFASAATGHPTNEANTRAKYIVQTGTQITPDELPLGAHGVIGVLQSSHGLTHGLHSVIGLGGGKCLSMIGRDGNIGITNIQDSIDYYQQWLTSIGFPRKPSIAEQGYSTKAPIKGFLAHFKLGLASMRAVGETDKVALYVKQ